MDRRQFLKSTVAVMGAATIGELAMAQPETTAGADKPELMAIVRVYGSILYSTRKWGGEGAELAPLTREQIDGWMKSCAAGGATAVLWRANCAGTLTYPSKFTGLAGEPPLPDPNEGMGIASVKQGWPLDDWQWLGEQCRRLDTLEAAVAAAHKYGLKIYLNFHTFDMVGSWCTPRTWPDGGDRAWDPDMWLWARDQKRRLSGVPCYADPKVRQRRLGELAEALEYDLDGVVLGFFSHCDGLSGEERCAFGYNPVVVAEYKKRYGVDPLTADVDPHKFYALHGEGYTQFVRGASKLVHAKGKKFISATRTDGIHGWGGKAGGGGLVGVSMQPADLRDGHSELPLTAGFYLETEQWAAEKLVDGLLCSVPFADGVKAAKQLRDKVNAPVYVWRKYTGFKGNASAPGLDVYRSEIAAARAAEIDGYCMLIMQITDHPWFKPDWRDLYSK